jgi:hypothetical protein
LHRAPPDGLAMPLLASRLGWWDALDLQAADGAYWLLLDLEGRTATWRGARYDPVSARLRARALGLDDAMSR